MKVFISQPMTGRSKAEILMERQAITNIVKRMYGNDTEIIDSYEESDESPVKLLGRAIEKLADADMMVIAPGGKISRGCRIEKACCNEYDIKYNMISKDAIKQEYEDMENIMLDTLQHVVPYPKRDENVKSEYKFKKWNEEFNLPVHPVRKTIIVINGKGGVGKDTLCRIAGEYFNVQSISAIDPIKEMARKHLHWDNDKSDKGRKLLSDLKAISIQYDDAPNAYLVSKAYDFMEPDNPSQILFIHIREPEEIDKFMHSISLRATCPVKTVLVRSDKLGKERYGNDSDDNVENYVYDYCFNNNGTLEEAEPAFIKFLLKEVMV